MATLEERIALRDELIAIFKERGILNRGNQVLTQKLVQECSKDPALDEKYKAYKVQFRCDEEALFCISHSSDMSEHLCPVCKQPAIFSLNTRPKQYKHTCGSNECIQALAKLGQARKKSEKPLQEKKKITNTSMPTKKVSSSVPKPEPIRPITTPIANSMYTTSKVEKRAIEQWVQRYKDAYNGDVIQDFEIAQVLDQTKEAFNISCDDEKMLTDLIYNNDEAFSFFVKELSKLKNRVIRCSELSLMFRIFPPIIRKTVERLNLLQYIYTQQIDFAGIFKKFVTECNINYIEDYVINDDVNQELRIDYLLPDFKLGIIVNYSGDTDKDSRYHQRNVIFAKACENIHLIYVWRWELTDTNLWKRLCTWIKDLVNSNKERVYARKCIVKEVSLEEEKYFLNTYHLQGYQKSTICYGLYYNGTLVQLMSFGTPRYNKNYQYELIRLCTRYGYKVIGGAERLYKHFIQDKKPSSIISYCNLDKFTGDVYGRLGMILSKKNQPQCMWYNTDTEDHFNQTSLGWIGADKLLHVNYGKGTDNKEIIRMYGYEAFFDCGLNVYTQHF